jgi:hypothetical protein
MIASSGKPWFHPGGLAMKATPRLSACVPIEKKSNGSFWPSRWATRAGLPVSRFSIQRRAVQAVPRRSAEAREGGLARLMAS